MVRRVPLRDVPELVDSHNLRRSSRHLSPSSPRPRPPPPSLTRRRHILPLPLFIAGDIHFLLVLAMTRPSTSSRPYTSSSSLAVARPGTATNPSDAYNRDPQYTYSQEYSIDEEDEESEEEGVFAFGPPSTADGAPSSPSFLQPHVSQPPPVYDPHTGSATYSYDYPGPSSLHPRHPYPQSPTVETPPSTDSQASENPYRFRRTETSSSKSHTGAKSAVSSAVSSREVHISLPRTQERIEEEQAEDPQKSRPPSSITSFPSMGSAAGSMK
jgi:hypothetical protein